MLKFYITVLFALFLFEISNAQVPVINSFSPASGPVGTVVTVNGGNFNASASSNIVFLGGVKATISSATTTTLKVIVPAGSTYQPMSVLNTANGLQGYSTIPFLTTFNSKNSLSSADFDAAQSFTAGAGTYEGLLADLDGDGKVDVVTVDNIDGKLGVFRNVSPTTGAISTASFAGYSNVYTGGDPEHIRLADMNGDGLPDIIATNQYSNKFTVLINTSTPGNITFQAQTGFTVGLNVSASSIYNIAVTDVNGDGKPDVVMITNSSMNRNVTVMPNTSTGGQLSFGAEVDFLGTTGVTSLSVGDLDNDGLPEIVITSDGVTIYHNTTTAAGINFDATFAIAKSTRPVTASLGDVDNDGKLDIIEANPAPASTPTTGSVSIYRNQSTPGSLSFATNVDFATGVPSLPILFNDMDGDGLPDIAVTGGFQTQILRNLTTGGSLSFASPVNIPINLPNWFGIADINGDGKPDVITTGFNFFDVYQNDPQSTVVQTPPTISSFSPQAAAVGAIVTINGTNFNSGATGNTVFFGATKGTVTSASSTQITATGPVGASYQPISVTNTGTNLSCYSAAPFIPTFQPDGKPVNFDPKVNFDTGGDPRAFAIGDIDGDGKPDIVLANYSSNTISVFRNISASGSIMASSFAPKLDFATPTAPTTITIGDLNFDGKPDIIVGCVGTNSLSVFRNTSVSGNITMAPIMNFLEHAGVNLVKVIDANADGKPDIVAVLADNEVVFYINRTVGTNIDNFSIIKDNLVLATDTGPSGLGVSDFDGDGKLDLVVSVSGAIGSVGAMDIFRNTSANGIMSYAATKYQNVGDWPTTLGVSDIDGDGKPDVVVSMTGPYNTNNVTIIPNTSTANNITFGTLASFSTGNDTRGLAIGDLDGDGKPDLTIINHSDSTVSVLLNTSAPGNFSFKQRTIFPTAGAPMVVSINDMDGDGKPDLVEASSEISKMSVLRFDTNPPQVPAILKVTYMAGVAGSSIYISGLNFTDATAVSFGGTPAKSFTVTSPTSITAVVGNGSTGTIKVTTPAGMAQATGFTYIPVPTISVTGNTTFQSGGSVVLTASPSPSGVYSYQWNRDGYAIPGATSPTYTASESGNYTVVLSCLNITQASTQSVKVTSVFALPSNNFNLTIISATCRGTNDGSVNITAAQNLSYTAIIAGNGLNASYPFATSTYINNLAAGTYSVCITVEGQSDYEQCYDVVISEPKDLSVYSIVNDADKTISLSLNGASQYNIQLNGSTYTTIDNSITLPLTAGTNNLVVTTDKLCQGTVQKLINISGKITPYPIPFQDILNLNIGSKNVETVLVEIHSLEDGRLVYSRIYNNQSGVLQLDVSKFKIGPYSLRLSLNNSETIYKISKQ
jgi:hypothetical protein